MRSHTYSKFSPELADAVDLQALLDKLADFLLQSGFAGGAQQPYYGWDFDGEGDRSLDALRQAILKALMESGQFTPEMLEALRGGEDEEGQAKLAQLLDQLGGRRLGEDLLAPQLRLAGAVAVVQHRGHVLEEAPRVLLAVLEQADLHAAQLGGAVGEGERRRRLTGAQAGGVKDRAGQGESSLRVLRDGAKLAKAARPRSVSAHKRL